MEQKLTRWDLSLTKWDLSKIEKEFHLIRDNKEFVVLDLETTGFHPDKGAKIIQIAAVRVKDGKLADEFSTYVNPEQSIPAKITELTGISNQDVQFAPIIEAVLPEFRKFIGGAVVVAHNAAFDWGTFLYPLFQEHGGAVENPYLCTFQLFITAHPGLGKGAYTNESLAKLFGIQLTDAHNAMNDVEATARSFMEIITWFSRVDFEQVKREAEEEAKRKEDTPVTIQSVRYWEKYIDPLTTHKRHYVRLKGSDGRGTVFYDIVKSVWRNKDYTGELNFLSVESAVLGFLGLENAQQLAEYREE